MNNSSLRHHAVMEKSVRAILVMLGSIIATCLCAEENAPSRSPFTLTNAIPIRSIVDILNHPATAAETNQVRVQGVVQANSASNSFFIHDRTGGVRIETAGTNDFKPGLLVDVVGSRTERGAMAVLTDVTVRRIGIGNTNDFALTNTTAFGGKVLTTVQQIRALNPE